MTKGKIQRLCKALDKAHDALEPFIWDEPSKHYGGGFQRLRSDIGQVLNLADRQLESGRGWLWNVEE